MNKKLLSIILLLCTYCSPLLLKATDFNEEDWAFMATATGNTTGHIGDLIITNKTSKPTIISLGSYVIPPKNDQQGYAVFNKKIEKIEVQAGGTYTHKLQGYCINVDLPAAIKKQAFPSYAKWLSIKDFDMAFVKIWNETEEVTPTTLNFNNQLKQAAPIILEAIRLLESEYHNWKAPLQIPDIYPGNAKAVKEAIIQQAIWQFTSALQGKTYSFQQFEDSILKQQRVKTWLSLNGPKSLTIDDQTIKSRTYLNYQCQKLWSIISDLNLYINPKGRKLMPQWKSNTGSLQSKYIEFIEIWENIVLTGEHFKDKTPVVNENKTNDTTTTERKIWPYIAGGAGAVGIVTAVVLLTKEKGCTNVSACNFDEDAKKDDGSCKMDDCLGICGGTAVIGAACDDGDNNTINDIYSIACKCIGVQLVRGCTNSCATNYNSNANQDDDSCILPKGCTNSAACNYDENACVDDGKCNLGNQACAYPCNEPNPDDGCDLTFDSINSTDCTISNTSNCPDNTTFIAVDCTCIVIEGCNDMCAPNYNPDANIDDGSCQPYDTSCNTDCSFGDIESWNQSNCKCETSTVSIEGCLNQFACNYNPDANCQNVVCDFGYTACAEPCEEPETDDGCDLTTDSFDKATCTITNMANCPFGETFDANACDCVSLVKTNPISNQIKLYAKQFSPFIENRMLTIPIKNSEFPEKTVITNIIGINYYQSISPMLFIENQTAVAYVPASHSYFLNNKITLNAKNPQLPIHYGLGFHSTQLTNILSISDWQNELIWNVGLKLPIFKQLQIEADIFKNFRREDALNYTVRFIYKKGKEKNDLIKPLKD